LYLDECEVHLHPTLTKVWTLRGVRPVIPAAGSNQRLCVYGAMNYRTGQTHYLVHPKKNAMQFREFLQQLLEAGSDRRLVLVIDNASYHRTRAILGLLEDHADHVFVLWLPRYSPELNLIEGLWGYLKRSALNNYFFGTVESLERAIHTTFENLHQHPETTLALAYRCDTKLRMTA
jgi:transposase